MVLSLDKSIKIENIEIIGDASVIAMANLRWAVRSWAFAVSLNAVFDEPEATAE